MNEVKLKLQIFFDYIDSLSEDIKESIYDYSSELGYHSELNEIMREYKDLNGHYKLIYKDLMFAFDNAPKLTDTITLYRGSDRFLNTDFNLNYFYSTSYDSNQALKFVENDNFLYVITCTPGNYSLLPIERISESPSEFEVILPPKGRFSIQKEVRKQDSIYNVPTIYITYIPETAIIVDTKKAIITDEKIIEMFKKTFL